MAITLNRNQEITEEQQEALKKKFRESTLSKAIYKCVKYVLENQKRDYLTEIETLTSQNEELIKNQKKIIETVKKKFIIDKDFEQLLLKN